MTPRERAEAAVKAYFNDCKALVDIVELVIQQAVDEAISENFLSVFTKRMEHLTGLESNELVKKTTAVERERILKFLTCAEIPGCWNWKAAKNDKGYGQYDREYAHRVAYEMFVGPIQEGLVIDHACRNHSCINPSHLRPLTNRENVLIGVGATAKHYRKSHCNHGHEFTPENTKHYKNTRVCRICVKKRNDARYFVKEDK